MESFRGLHLISGCVALAVLLSGCSASVTGDASSEAGPSAAHPETRHIAALPVGTVVFSRRPDGSASSRRVVAKEADRVRVTSHEGADGDGPVTGRQVYDPDGNLLRSEDARGRVWRYEPHNCDYVIGRCEYTSIGPTRTDRHRREQERDGLTLTQRWYWCPSRFDCRLRQSSTSGYSQDGLLLWFEQDDGPGRVTYGYRFPQEG